MIRKILKSVKVPAFRTFTFKPSYKYFNQQPNFNPEKNYYQILELSKDASDADIKKSYYKLAKQYHPDVNKGYETRFKEISEAYEVLSNDQTRKQYDSARTFREGWSKMGSRAQQGSYSYEEYQNIFYSMSPQEREQFQRQSQARIRRFGMYLGGFILFWIFFSRTPHKAYSEFNGTLIPIQPTAPFSYPDSYMAQQHAYNPYGGPSSQGQGYGAPQYGQNQAYSQPYPVASSTTYPQQQYGSQYPQAQYLNQYTQRQQHYQPPPQAYPQQPQYSNYPQQPQQPKSQFTIDKPQPHQPYPNSGYAQKPMQTNYQPNYKAEAPKGLED